MKNIAKQFDMHLPEASNNQHSGSSKDRRKARRQAERSFTVHVSEPRDYDTKHLRDWLEVSASNIMS